MELIEVFRSDFKIEEAKDSKTIAARLRYAFVLGDVRNGNDRIYSSRILKREIGRMKARIAESPVAGMLNHPKFTSATEIDKISHIITDVSWLESERKGVAVSSVLETQKGKDLLIILKSNVKIGASIRGFGDVASDEEVMNNYRLESIDLVIGPSFGRAVQIDKTNLIESGNQFFSNQSNMDDMRLKYRFAMASGARLTFADFVKTIKEK